jgi:hypothetical protein
MMFCVFFPFLVTEFSTKTVPWPWTEACPLAVETVGRSASGNIIRFEKSVSVPVKWMDAPESIIHLSVEWLIPLLQSEQSAKQLFIGI